MAVSKRTRVGRNSRTVPSAFAASLSKQAHLIYFYNPTSVFDYTMHDFWVLTIIGELDEFIIMLCLVMKTYLA